MQSFYLQKQSGMNDPWLLVKSQFYGIEPLDLYYTQSLCISIMFNSYQKEHFIY